MPVCVLFVCLGNICRSPIAEAVFRQVVEEAGLSDQIVVDSAGTSSWHIGEMAHPGTLKVLSQHGIDYQGHARQASRRDFAEFDYILAMDEDNLTDLRTLAPTISRVVLKRFLDFAEGAPTRNMPDPYYSGNFEEVYDLARQGAEGLLQHIRQEKGL